MPYVKKGNAVYRKDTGQLVGHSANPTRYLRTLNAIEHGFVPNKQKNEKKNKKS